MNIARFERIASLASKYSQQQLRNLRPTAIQGRFVGPKVLLNSIPKAGTNLLEQALVHFPYLHRSTFRTVRGWEKIDEKTINAISNLERGGIMVGHLPAHAELLNILVAHEIKVLLMVRDPRDLIISYVKYVTHIDRTHPAHSYFLNLPDDESRIMAVIAGVDKVVSPIAETLEKFSGWLDFQNAMIVRFEDIIGAKGGGSDATQKEVINRIASFLNIPVKGKSLLNICNTVYSTTSITFRKPQIGGWQAILKDEHITALRLKAGPLMERYGYTS